MKTKTTSLAVVVVLAALSSGCSTYYEDRPVPWAKAKVYQAVDMTGLVEHTYIRKPDYYSQYMLPSRFQTCHNYYLNDFRCATPVKVVGNCHPVAKSCGCTH